LFKRRQLKSTTWSTRSWAHHGSSNAALAEIGKEIDRPVLNMNSPVLKIAETVPDRLAC